MVNKIENLTKKEHRLLADGKENVMRKRRHLMMAQENYLKAKTVYQKRCLRYGVEVDIVF